MDDLECSAQLVVLPSWVVGAVCEVKGGAFPSYAQGYYPRNNAFYKAWDAIARERETFQAWIERHVLGTQGFRRVQAQPGDRRCMRCLKAALTQRMK